MERHPLQPTDVQPADRTTEAAIESLGTTLRSHDFQTYAHSVRLTLYARLLGNRLGLSRSRLLTLQCGALLHDIGKLLVREQILVKPGPLSEPEWSAMRQHPAAGYRLATAASVPEPVARIVLTHHEWYDGTGYPLRIKGKAIPLEARICAAVDMLDALTADRPYRRRINFEEAMTEIAAERESHFDPMVVEALLAVPASEWIRLSRFDRPTDDDQCVEPTVGPFRLSSIGRFDMPDAKVIRFCGV